jgi:hypothetical protein
MLDHTDEIYQDRLEIYRLFQQTIHGGNDLDLRVVMDRWRPGIGLIDLTVEAIEVLTPADLLQIMREFDDVQA